MKQIVVAPLKTIKIKFPVDRFNENINESKDVAGDEEKTIELKLLQE